jgi:hypothetical protein
MPRTARQRKDPRPIGQRRARIASLAALLAIVEAMARITKRRASQAGALIAAAIPSAA